jgi:hypothetical protein
MPRLSIAEVVGSNPPGPYLSTRELRHYFELDFSDCRTRSYATVITVTRFALIMIGFKM